LCAIHSFPTRRSSDLVLAHPIGLRSQLGRGSVFSVTVPLGDPAAVEPEPAPLAMPDTADDSPLRGCRVWCVDDDPHVCEGARARSEEHTSELQSRENL